MTIYDDVMTVENGAEDEETYYLAIQRLINAGQWSFQGSFGRTMMAAIENGDCMLGTESAHDYWGNRIPSRSEVQEGTKGSRGFVVEHRGEEWAAKLDAA